MSRPIVFIEEAEAGAPAAAPYELFAIKYAHNPSRRSAVFLGGDVHDGPMPMDYFVWLAVGKDRTVLIDTGFKKSVADRRGRDWRCCPGEDEDVVHVIRRLYAGRVALHDGDAQLAPGLQVYLVGGHTPGMQK